MRTIKYKKFFSKFGDGKLKQVDDFVVFSEFFYGSIVNVFRYFSPIVHNS